MKVQQENTVKRNNIFKTFVSSSEFRVAGAAAVIILITTAFKPDVYVGHELHKPVYYNTVYSDHCSRSQLYADDRKCRYLYRDVAGLGGIMVALFISVNGMPWYVAMVLSLLICAMIGIVNGIMVVKLNGPTLMATMATLNICGAVRV